MLFLLFELVSGLVSLTGLFENERDKERYLQFMSTYGGTVTEEVQENLKKDFNLYNGAENKKNELREALEGGSIDKEEFNEQSNQITEYLSGREVFLSFYEDCDYTLADAQNRQIVNTKQWNWLFGEEKLDFFFIITIIILVLFSVISENESSFASIKNTCQNGREKLFRLDLNICYVYAGAMSLLLSGVRLIIALGYFGGIDSSASLQSLPLFENSNYDISLFEGFAIISLLKMLGGIAFAALSIIAGYFLKSSLSVLLFSLFVAIIPPYVFSSPMLYYISPVSLLIANGYLFGDVILTGNEVGATIVYSTAVSIAAPIISVVIALCLIISSYKFNKRRAS